ncbi:MAG: phenol hydroxylase [Piscirickettsiaceae bacterium]|nr:MAG: phenol hydroxylase [Piscirickettsiaceae bacterium]
MSDIGKQRIEPLRVNYAQIERRIGNKPATRYQEATYDIQSEVGFHYKPIYDSGRDLYDKKLTKIVMKDWYSFMDPRQYFYTPYVTVRANQGEVMDKNHAMIDKQDLLDSVPEALKQKVRKIIIPLRHVEYAANMNNQYIADKGYGASITGVAAYNGFDHVAMSQYISKLSLILDGNEETTLESARDAWLNDEMWQPLRRVVEDIWVIDDWFETMVAQNIVLDGLLHPLIFDRLVKDITGKGGLPIAMLLGFMGDWYTETIRWTNQLVKITAKESEENSTLLTEWIEKWVERVDDALKPVAVEALGSNGVEQLAEVKQELLARLAKQGIEV